MGLVRMGGAAFDLAEVVGVVPRREDAEGEPKDRATVYLRNAIAVELCGEEARAFLAFVGALPADPAEGKRVAVPRRKGADLGEPRG